MELEHQPVVDRADPPGDLVDPGEDGIAAIGPLDRLTPGTGEPADPALAEDTADDLERTGTGDRIVGRRPQAIGLCLELEQHLAELLDLLLDLASAARIAHGVRA